MSWAENGRFSLPSRELLGPGGGQGKLPYIASQHDKGDSGPKSHFDRLSPPSPYQNSTDRGRHSLLSFGGDSRRHNIRTVFERPAPGARDAPSPPSPIPSTRATHDSDPG